MVSDILIRDTALARGDAAVVQSGLMALVEVLVATGQLPTEGLEAVERAMVSRAGWAPYSDEQSRAGAIQAITATFSVLREKVPS